MAKKVPVLVVGNYICPRCGEDCESAYGLLAHYIMKGDTCKPPGAKS